MTFGHQVVLVARRRIEAQEQLFYSYSQGCTRCPRRNADESSSGNVECACGDDACNKFIFT
jgi:hypothetical protein